MTDFHFYPPRTCPPRAVRKAFCMKDMVKFNKYEDKFDYIYSGGMDRYIHLPLTTPFPLPSGVERVVLLADVENLAISLDRLGHALSEDLLLAWLKAYCARSQVLAFCAEDSYGMYRTEVLHDGAMVKLIKPGKSYGYDLDAEMCITAATKIPKEADGVIIGSGDGHMLPLILHLKAQGLQVGVLSVPGSTASALRHVDHVHHVHVGRDLVVPIDRNEEGRQPCYR